MDFETYSRDGADVMAQSGRSDVVAESMFPIAEIHMIAETEMSQIRNEPN
jgi:hypothetical protein